MTPLKFEVKSLFGDYSVEFLSGLQECLMQAKASGGTHFLADDRVFELYRADFGQAGVAPILWKATEENKTFSQLEALYGHLMDAGFRKNSRLVVIGGGILQDAGGFVASTIYRGCTWDLIPTTLLAQADSCIGAKTSVNLTRAKNQIGTFSAPKRVLMTSTVLKTLSSGDISSGLCEAVKLAMVDNKEDVEWMRTRLGSAMRLEGLEEFLYRALKIKRRYIEEDEFDRGVRNLLNYGHTFAHAFEILTQYAIPHGVAVGIGMEAAVYFSMRLGFVSESHFVDVRAITRELTADFMTLIRGHTAAEYVNVMKSDKKNTSSDITFILTRGYGQMMKQPLPTARATELLSEYLMNP